MPDKDLIGKDFDPYEGYLEPEPEDVGDEEEQFNFLLVEEYVDKNESKHYVSTEEIRQVLANRPLKKLVERGYTPGEDKYTAVGHTNGGRQLMVVYILKIDGRILPISAYTL